MRGLTEIFNEALEIPEDRRPAFLDEACGEDQELRAEVESILSYYRGDTITNAPSTAAVARRFQWPDTAGRRRIALFALALSVLTAVSGFVVSGMLQAHLESGLRARLSSTLQEAVRAHRTWIEGWKTDLAEYAENPELRARLLELAQFAQGRDVLGSELVELEAHQELQRLVRPLTSREDVRNVNAANREYLLIFFDTYNYRDRVFRMNADGARRLAPGLAGETGVSAPHRIRTNLVDEGEPGDATQIAVVTPVRGDDGVIFAVLILRLYTGASITRLLHDVLGDSSGDLYAIDAQGSLVSRTRHERELERIGLLRDGKSSVMNVSSRDPGGDLSEGFSPEDSPVAWPLTRMAALATAGQSGLDVRGYRDFRGKDVVGAWEWLADYGIGIAHEMETDVVYASLRRVRLAFALTAAGLGGLAAFGFLSTLSIGRLRERVLEAERLGQYRLEETIGEGGMATVYRARHSMLQRPVAIKVLRGDRMAPETVARFKREVKIVSRLSHRNTIQILDYGQAADGSPFFVMELVSGITLTELIRAEAAVPVGRAVHLLAQVCQALGEAHRLGIVHRDIKPANIMVGERPDEGDVVKVLDFGLARTVAQASTQITQQHLLGGTLVYIAPERIQNPAIVTPASDVYAFGAVAFYLLTGREIIEGASPEEVLVKTVAGAQVAPSELKARDIPPELDALVAQCLSPAPADRPTIDECLSVLRGLSDEFRWSQEDSRTWWQRYRVD